MTQQAEQNSWPTELRLNPEKTQLRVAFADGIRGKPAGRTLARDEPECRGSGAFARRAEACFRQARCHNSEDRACRKLRGKARFQRRPRYRPVHLALSLRHGGAESGALGRLSEGNRSGGIEPRAALSCAVGVSNRGNLPSSCPSPPGRRDPRWRLEPRRGQFRALHMRQNEPALSLSFHCRETVALVCYYCGLMQQCARANGPRAMTMEHAQQLR